MDECFKGRICSREGGTVVQGGTGRPCYASTLADFEGTHGRALVARVTRTVVCMGHGWHARSCVGSGCCCRDGTVVRYGTGDRASSLDFENEGCFWCFYILACGMYLGVMWVTKKPWLWYQLMYMWGGKWTKSNSNQTKQNGKRERWERWRISPNKIEMDSVVQDFVYEIILPEPLTP